MFSSIADQWEELRAILEGSVNVNLIEDIDKDDLISLIEFLKPFKVLKHY
jgi:hypothetical protein